jgi:hypothetical protein
MRVMRVKLFVFVLVLVAGCGSGAEPGDDEPDEIGECAPAVGATELAATPTDLFDSCIAQSVDGVNVVGSQAEWDALFDCAEPLPQGLDFATQRAAVVHRMCAPVYHRFTAETAGEVVVGIYTHATGACLGNVLVVPLPLSAKPVRLATCEQNCGDCPPLP